VQRPKDGSDVTGFGSFDNSTSKRVLDLLELGDLRLGQVVINRVAVVKLGVNSDIEWYRTNPGRRLPFSLHFET